MLFKTYRCNDVFRHMVPKPRSGLIHVMKTFRVEGRLLGKAWHLSAVHVRVTQPNTGEGFMQDMYRARILLRSLAKEIDKDSSDMLLKFKRWAVDQPPGHSLPLLLSDVASRMDRFPARGGLIEDMIF